MRTLLSLLLSRRKAAWSSWVIPSRMRGAGNMEVLPRQALCESRHQWTNHAADAHPFSSGCDRAETKVVVFLAGTNDIAGNTGPMTLEAIEDNLASMAELAQANNIKVVLGSVLPVCDYIKPQTERRPPAKVIALNAWIKDYAAKNGFVYLDYYSAMLDDKEMFRKELTYDGLHPNDAGYEVMEPLAEKAITAALGEIVTSGLSRRLRLRRGLPTSFR